MKYPFVRRKLYEEAVSRQGMTIAYIPASYPEIDGKPVKIPSEDYCYHDRRIGWVRRVDFKTYKEYTEYLKEVYRTEGWVEPPKKKKNK